jgi:exopolysaccharide biosynthesis WecB/TagA/CpsF family protein
MTGCKMATSAPLNDVAMTRSPALIDFLDALTIVPDEAGRDDLLASISAPPEPTVIGFVNAQAVNLAWRDVAFRQSLAEADILLRDGIGMKIGLRVLGRQYGLNMNGTDVIPLLMKAMAPCRAAFFGSALTHAIDAALNAEKWGIEPTAVRGGFEADTVYVNEAMRTKPDLIVLGMGMPKQERVALMIRDAMTRPCVIVAGGAIIDFMSGRFPRAPLALRALGLEWLFRMTLEPRRLAGRYLIGNAAFLLRIAAIRAALRSFASPLGEKQREEEVAVAAAWREALRELEEEVAAEAGQRAAWRVEADALAREKVVIASRAGEKFRNTAAA